MDSAALKEVRAVLLHRRARLALIAKWSPDNVKFQELFKEVDAALSRISSGNYGTCEICNEPIEVPRLKINPLLRFCLSHIAPEDKQKFDQDQQLVSAVRSYLTETLDETIALEQEDELFGEEQEELFGLEQEDELFGEVPPRAKKEDELFLRELVHPRAKLSERVTLALSALKAAWSAFLGRAENHSGLFLDGDLDRASLIQAKMLPGRRLRLNPWDIYYAYRPLVEVGGDYCDLIPADSGRLFLFFGDAVGKGVSASLIASQLHALFRTLASLASPFEEMAERANRIFCESMAIDHYATVVCGHALPDGKLELVNAGHPPPLLLRGGRVTKLEASGLPLGLFYSSKYDVVKLQLAQGETILFYTDGVTEARNNLGVEYGCERLASLDGERYDLIPEELVHTCLRDLYHFTLGSHRSDDLTMMAMRRH